MARSIIALILLSSISIVRFASAQATKEKLLTKTQAIAAAEKFVAAPGAIPAGTMPVQPHAAGARLDSGLWFVGFNTSIPNTLRGVTVDAKTGAAKLLSHNLQPSWLFEAVQTSTETVKGAAQPAPAKKKKGKKAKAVSAPAAPTPAPAP